MSAPRTCRRSGKSFVVSNAEGALLKQMNLPLPDLSPEERIRSAMASRNEWKLYRRKCDATGADILSAYAPESQYTVYRNDVWWGDSWDALAYAMTFDFGKSFFSQYIALQKVVPREGTSVFRSENCKYNSHIRESKNCYMNALNAKSEDTHYSYWIENGKDVVDCMYTNFSTLCYECRDCSKCYEATSLEESSNCNDCHFSYQLIGCSQCLFCTNLANRTLYMFNKPCTEAEFQAAKKGILNGSYKAWAAALQRYKDVRAQAPHRALHNLNCEHTLADHFYNAKNCTEVFDGHDCEDCMNSVSLSDSKSIASIYSTGWPGCELVYFSSVIRGSQDVAFCSYIFFGNDLRYCDSCISCKHCFGCIGLRHKEYCILNKQYTKEEYEAILPKIIEHMRKTDEWGRYFPSETLPFAYNETAAQDYMPLKKEEAVAMGFHWRDVPDEIPAVSRVVSAAELPDRLQDAPANLTQQAYACTVTKKPFRIVKQELDFYHKMSLPLPRVHPVERHHMRLAQRNPYRFWERPCMKCGKKMQTTYPPDRPEVVYCEECYRKEIY